MKACGLRSGHVHAPYSGCILLASSRICSSCLVAVKRMVFSLQWTIPMHQTNQWSCQPYTHAACGPNSIRPLPSLEIIALAHFHYAIRAPAEICVNRPPAVINQRQSGQQEKNIFNDARNNLRNLRNLRLKTKHICRAAKNQCPSVLICG